MHSPEGAGHAARSDSPVRLKRYRPDIDGLRAVAVVSVVVFHAFPNVLRSGFVGVDIFFVISGFLITSIILDDLHRERFSFATFYAHRIRRIFPALIVVLLACLVAGWFLLWTDEFGRLGKHTAAGATFISNFVLWKEAGYFDVDSKFKILLHLWSLGIEEQFYLLWPGLIWIAWRLRLNLLTFFSAIFVASLAYSIKATPSNPAAAFYLPVARFWELAVGAILGRQMFSPWLAAWIEPRLARAFSLILFERRNVDEEQLYRDSLSALGMALIAASVFVIVRLHEFPGWWALMPVVGTYLTIAAGPGGWFNRVVLSSPAMVRIGLISYPLYLWHWPLLAFTTDYFHTEAQPELRAALMAVAVSLAWLTYRFIEKPIRFGQRRRWIAPSLCATLLVLAAYGAVAFSNNGFPGRLPDDKSDYIAFFDPGLQRMVDEAKQIQQFQCDFYAWDSPTPTMAPRTVDPSCYTRHSAKSVLILGDSNGADLYYGLNKVLPEDISVLLLYSSGCRVQAFSEQGIHVNHCDMANYFALNRIKEDPPDTVLMSSYNSFDIDYIRQFSTMIKQYGVKHVLVLGQRPHWYGDLYRIILQEYWSYTPRYIPGHLDQNLHAFGDRFKAQMRADEPFEYVDELQPFCNPSGCLAYIGEDRRDGLVTSDTAHLRPIASVYLAKQQLAPLILKLLSH